MSTITRRPKSDHKAQVEEATEAEVQAVIHKGLSVRQENGADTDKEAQVKLRLPDALLKRVMQR